MIRIRPPHALVALVLLSSTACASGRAGAPVADPSTGRAGSPTRVQQSVARGQSQLGTPNYDIVLEVPELSVDSIGLNVEELRAHLALDANVMNLVALNAGVDVGIDQVQLELTGVLAEAYLYVDLDNVTYIVARVVRTLDNNPQILTQLLTTVDTVVGTVGMLGNTLLQPGGVAGQAVGVAGQTLEAVTQPAGLLSQTVNTLGQTVRRTIDTTGQIVEQTLDSAGNLVGSRAIGSLLQLQNLQLLGETTNAAGQIVRQVRDETGAVIEYTLDQAGNITRAEVVRQAPQTPR
jgi:hypothetical protein